MARSSTKTYNFNGISGCVVQKKSRQTGTLVGVYNSEQSEVGDVGDSSTAWMTVCEEHNVLVGHSSLKLALYHSSDPEGWCESCRARGHQYVLDEDPLTEAFSFNDFIKNNESLPEDDKEGVRDLDIGESMKLGGGAAAEFTIKRVA